jgi:hypothetical protein
MVLAMVLAVLLVVQAEALVALERLVLSTYFVSN